MRIILAGFFTAFCFTGSSFAETCEAVNPSSAVDQAFVASLLASSIRITSSTAQMSCFNDSDATFVSNLRARIDAENPQGCLTFEKHPELASDFEVTLQQKRIPFWRSPASSGITMCYLLRDAKSVEEAVKSTLAPSADRDRSTDSRYSDQFLSSTQFFDSHVYARFIEKLDRSGIKYRKSKDQFVIYAKVDAERVNAIASELNAEYYPGCGAWFEDKAELVAVERELKSKNISFTLVELDRGPTITCSPVYRNALEQIIRSREVTKGGTGTTVSH